MNHRLVIDAGPLIAAFHAQDTYHAQSVEGLTYLNTHKIVVLIPLPIVFEVYKWLLYHYRTDVARQALQSMKDEFTISVFGEKEFEEIQSILMSFPKWAGSLEDATVIESSLRYGCPVWTYNYRDFSAFQKLDFWTP